MLTQLTSLKLIRTKNLFEVFEFIPHVSYGFILNFREFLPSCLYSSVIHPPSCPGACWWTYYIPPSVKISSLQGEGTLPSAKSNPPKWHRYILAVPTGNQLFPLVGNDRPCSMPFELLVMRRVHAKLD